MTRPANAYVKCCVFRKSPAVYLSVGTMSTVLIGEPVQESEEFMKAILRTQEQNQRVEELAKDLHRHYRATFKALHHITRAVGQFECDAPNHDHGWQGMHQEKILQTTCG